MQAAGAALESLLSPQALRDPAAGLALLRDHDPVMWVPGLDAWLVTRHDDVRQLFADPRVTADPRAYERYRPPSPGRAERWLSELPFLATPADPQARGRRLVSTALTSRAVARVEQQVREVVEEFAAPLRRRGGVVELVAELTEPIPGTVIGRIAGVPPKGSDEVRFRQLARKVVRGVNPLLSDGKRQRSEEATVELCEYVLGLVLARRERPAEDLISDLLRVSASDTPAAAEEIVRVIVGLVSAGTETTVLAGTRALRTLLRHPGELALLRAEPALLPNAIDELLRYDVGLPGMPRYVLEEFELRGRLLGKGQLVVLSLLAAHRDPRVFPDPDRLDLRREVRDLVVFGRGPHYCMGAHIARAQLRFLVEAALELLPLDARLLEESVRWSAKGLLSRIKSLPVDFGDRGRAPSPSTEGRSRS